MDRLAFDFSDDPEWEDRATRELLRMLGPGGFIVVVHQHLYDEVKKRYPDMDLPGLVLGGPLPVFTAEPRPPTLSSAMPPAPHLGARPLPYPPHKKGRYAR